MNLNLGKLRLGKLKLGTVQSVIALACSLNLGLALAVPPGPAPPGKVPPIGTVAAEGSFRVDEATVAGNATLFEGTTVETHQSGSTLDLASGARLRLDAASKGRIFSDRLLLDRGSGQMEKAAGFRVEAGGLTVRTETGAGSARVILAENAHVQVAALAGPVRVLNSQGVLVASIHSGNALEFAFQTSAGEAWKVTGCLRAMPGHYLILDEVTNVTVEVAGPGLDKQKGNRVEITGAMDPAKSPVSGATQFIRVTGIKRLSNRCVEADKAAPAGAGGAAGNAGNAGATGKSGGHAGLPVAAIAVIAGVAAAAVVGGLAVSGTLAGSSAASVSR